ncbi:MAG TPA: sigma-70 family RNA polymerase sigma factor [Thermoanaerobaculia bacterium]|nr:sigma-70 family RNA polymerase sigma factor [Thermoanaerobaculia bacterium]
MQAAIAPRTAPPGVPIGPATLAPLATLERIFELHHRAVFHAAYRVTGNPSDAEDVVQTVFFRLARREELDLTEQVGSYLHRAGVNAALDLMRARKRARAVALDEVAEALPEEPAHGPERRRENRELARALRSAVSQLSPRQAEIFSLRYFEGLSNLDISRMLDCSQTAVAVILHRARHRLQKELAAHEGGWS